MAEIPKSERMELALQAWRKGNGALTLRKAAKRYGVNYSTLNGQNRGCVFKKQASQAMQRLSLAKEDSLQEWILLLES